MNPVRCAWRLFVVLVVLLCTPWPAFAEESGPVFVVATPELQGPYRGTVILAAPLGDGHAGVILNRPSRTRMAELFPDHAPSQKVKDPVYVGGPVHHGAIFALVRRSESPHAHSIELAPGVWLVIEQPGVDALMEADPNQARYFAGVVLWGAGELAGELEQGLFLRRPVDPGKLFLPDPSGLHEDLAPKKGQVEL